jgi:hypothetical protein
VVDGARGQRSRGTAGLVRLASALLAGVQAPASADRPPRWFVWATLALGVAFALAYQLGAPIRASYGARVNVDEPFYLLTTVSLLEDGDLDLRNDYDLRRYRAFFDHKTELWYQSRPGPAGRVLSPHNVGLSVLILPAYAAGGVDGVKAFLGVLGGATVGLCALVAGRATGRAGASLLAAGLVGSTAPQFVYATQIYPELPAGLVLLGCLYVLLGRRRGVRSAVLLAAGLTALVWLGSKYAVVGGVVAALGLARLPVAGRWWLVALGALSAAAYAAFHTAVYGGLTPYTVNLVYAGASTRELVAFHFEVWSRLYRLAGLWVDAEFGLVRWAPLLLLTLPGLVPLLRQHRPVSVVVLGIVGTQVVVAAFLSITMRGWWFPGRMLVPVLPLLAIPLATALESLRGRVTAAVLGGYTVAVTGALVVAGRAGEVTLAIDPFRLRAPLFQGLSGLFPRYTEYTAATWVLTAAWVALAVGLVALPLRPGIRTTRAARTAEVSV